MQHVQPQRKGYHIKEGGYTMSYSIGEFSRITGLGVHTLRYYEHEGLITPQRNEQNRRCYSDDDIAWAEFLMRLKAAGMPIREIRRYSELRAQGDSTIEERIAMLRRHDEFLDGQIRQLMEHKLRLAGKIQHYLSLRQS